MSGPVAMMLGAFAFEAIGFGFDGVGRSLNTQWAEIPVAQSLNQLQWTGPTSEEVTIKGVLFPVEYGGQGSLDGIISSANAGLPLMLVSGSSAQGNIHGLFTVQGVEEDRSVMTRDGTPRRNAYSIKLKRYGDSFASAGGGLFSLF